MAKKHQTEQKLEGPANCTVSDTDIIACCGMAQQMGRCEDATGLIPMRAINFAKGTSRFIGVCFKRRARDKGVMLNNCPWCGRSIKNWRN